MDFSHDFQVAIRRKDNDKILKEQKAHLIGLLQEGRNMKGSMETVIIECISRHPELAGRREKYRIDKSLGETSLLLLLCSWNASLRLVETVVAACPHSIRSSDFSTKLVYSLPLHMACYSRASVELIQYLHEYNPEASTKLDFHTQLPLCYALLHHENYLQLLPMLATRRSLEAFVDFKWNNSAANSLSDVLQTLVKLFQCVKVALTLRNGSDKIFELDQDEEHSNQTLCISWDAASDDLQALSQALRHLSIPVTKVLLRECNSNVLAQSILPIVATMTQLSQVHLMSTTMNSLLLRLFWIHMMNLPLLDYIFMYDLNWTTPACDSDFEGLSQLRRLKRLSIITCRVKSAFMPAVTTLLRSSKSSLTSLNITANRLDAESIKSLAESLIGNTQLKRLVATNIQTSSTPIVKVLSESNCHLIECMIQDKSEAACYTALNKAGRQVARDPNTTKYEFVALLIHLEDTTCIFGLLLENPTLWSK